jgi:hypothetical protein
LVIERFFDERGRWSDAVQIQKRNLSGMEHTPGVWFFTLTANVALQLEKMRHIWQLPEHRSGIESSRGGLPGRDAGTETAGFIS